MSNLNQKKITTIIILITILIVAFLVAVKFGEGLYHILEK